MTTAQNTDMGRSVRNGTPKKMKNINRSSGTARKNSTTTPDGSRSHQWSEYRPTANTRPKISDSTIATAAAAIVFPRPGMM